MKKAISFLLAALLVLSLASCGARDVKSEENSIPEAEEADEFIGETITAAEEPEKEPEEEPKRIIGWSEDSTAMAEIMATVENITDESSPDYVPPEKRIAVFDFDGTLIGERYPTVSDRSLFLYRLLHDDTYTGSQKYVLFARTTEKAIANHEELPITPVDRPDGRRVICGFHRGGICGICAGFYEAARARLQGNDLRNALFCAHGGTGAVSGGKRLYGLHLQRWGTELPAGYDRRRSGRLYTAVPGDRQHHFIHSDRTERYTRIQLYIRTG